MTVDGVLSNVGTVIGTVVDIISGNPVLSSLLGLAVVSVGAMAFKQLLAR
jgi:hypothetical protein